MIHWLRETDSTNNEALRHLNSAPEGTVWTALFQTAGRGQQQNVWVSEAGQNMLFSLLLRPTWLPPEEQFYISKVTSLGVCDFLAQHHIRATVKWPNDIYAGNRKMAGLLIENHISGSTMAASIIGVGLNANQRVFPDTITPTSMYLENGQPVDIREALSPLVGCIMKRYAQLHAHQKRGIDSDYLSLLYRFNEWHWFERNGQRFRAKITGVQHNGLLLVADEKNKTAAFAFKEIRFL